MYANVPILSILLFLGIAQALFLATAYLQSGVKAGASHKLLAGLLIVLALSTGNGFFYQTELYEDLGWLIGIPVIFQFLVGPVFWFYVKSLTDSGFRLRIRDTVHLGPALAYLLLALPFLTQGPLYKIVLMYSWLHQDRPIGDYLSQFWYELALPLQSGVYFVLVWGRIRNHERHLRDNYSTIDDLTIHWLKRVVGVFALGMGGLSLGYILILFGVELNGAFLCGPAAYTLVVFYFTWVTIKRAPAGDPWSVHQIPCFPEKVIVPTAPEEKQGTEGPKAKYSKSPLPDGYGNRILHTLEETMRTEKPYLDPDLTLESLAQMIRTSRNHLSQVLNHNLETTFYEYVNRYRIKEAAENLIGPGAARQDILSVAGDCGFHSKSTFNKVFKAWYGVSPSEYKRGLRCPPLDGVAGDKGII